MDRPVRSGFEVRRFETPAEMAAEQAAYWRDRPAHEKFAETARLSTAAYLLADPTAGVTRMDKTLFRWVRSDGSGGSGASEGG